MEIEADIFVFHGHVANALDRLDYFKSILTRYEKKRAEKFVFDKDRNLYIISHGLLREQLAIHLAIPIDRVEIRFEQNKKPFLIGNKMPDFNLTHSGDAFAFTICNSLVHQVGIDIEKPKANFDFHSIIENYMHPSEIAYITDNSTQKAEQAERFYEVWTRKEAVLKMCGIGIVANLPDINTCNGTNKCVLQAPEFPMPVPNYIHIESFILEDIPLSLAYNSQKPLRIGFHNII